MHEGQAPVHAPPLALVHAQPREGNFCLNWEIYYYCKEKVMLYARLYLSIMSTPPTPLTSSWAVRAYGVCFYSLLQLRTMQGAAAAIKPCSFSILKAVPVFLLYRVPDKRWATPVSSTLHMPYSKYHVCQVLGEMVVVWINVHIFFEELFLPDSNPTPEDSIAFLICYEVHFGFYHGTISSYFLGCFF